MCGLKLWTQITKAAQKREKQEWANEKPKLDSARKMRGVYFNDPEDEEFKETVKNARTKLEVPMEAAMPCRKKTTSLTCLQETVARLGAPNKVPQTKYACTGGSHEPTRQRMEPTLLKCHEDHIAGKEYNSMNHCDLVQQFLKAVKIPDAKTAAEKEWKKLETIQAWQQKLDNARKLRGIYVVDPDDMEFNETIQNARTKPVS